MSLGRFFFHDIFTQKALSDVDVRLKTMRRADLSAKLSSARRMNALEADLAHLALIVRALGDVILAKGVATPSDLEAALAAADVLDGASDQRLSPKLAKPGTTAPPPAPEPAKKGR